MVYHFAILSDEVEDFRREIDIDGEATFRELHDALLKTCEYKDDLMTSFFLCADDWSKDMEITMIDMFEGEPREDVYGRGARETRVMDRTHLDDVLRPEPGDKLMFLFDPMCERHLYMQVKAVEEKRHLAAPVVTLTAGKAPKQTEDIEKLVRGLDEEAAGMYGDDDWDPSEIDEEGYQSLDDIEAAGSGPLF